MPSDVNADAKLCNSNLLTKFFAKKIVPLTEIFKIYISHSIYYTIFYVVFLQHPEWEKVCVEIIRFLLRCGCRAGRLPLYLVGNHTTWNTSDSFWQS